MSRGITVLAIILTLLGTGTAYAQSCPPACGMLISTFMSKGPQIARLQDILKRNEDYLKANVGASQSVLVKVRSNILMTKLQIETEQNEKLSSETPLSKKPTTIEWFQGSGDLQLFIKLMMNDFLPPALMASEPK